MALGGAGEDMGREVLASSMGMPIGVTLMATCMREAGLGGLLRGFMERVPEEDGGGDQAAVLMEVSGHLCSENTLPKKNHFGISKNTGRDGKLNCGAHEESYKV